jgi:membrane protease YdiL (CAAX protease family)
VSFCPRHNEASGPTLPPVALGSAGKGFGMTQLLRRHPLVTFFALVYALTWVVWIPRAVGDVPFLVGRAWTWAPAVATIVAAAIVGGRGALRDLGSRLVRWRVGWPWYAIVILGPAVFSVAVAWIYGLFGGSMASAMPLALTDTPLPLVPLFLLIYVFTDGIGEELAWRGFALPRLLSRYSALVASLGLGLLWAAWHLPLLWTEGAAMYQQPIWLPLVDITAKSVLFTWVFVHTRGSVLLAVLFHSSTNLFLVSPSQTVSGDLTLPVLAAAAKWILVLVLVGATGSALVRRRTGTADEAMVVSGDAVARL